MDNLTKDSIKIIYAMAHLEIVNEAIHKISPECSEKVKECLKLLEELRNIYPPYRGHSLEYDYYNTYRS